jgi:hypothetical protein
MTVVSAHDADLQRAKTSLNENRQQVALIQRDLDADGLQPKHLFSSTLTVRGAADRLALVHPDSRELVEWCGFIARATAALFTYARRPERDRWRLLGVERTLSGKVPADALDDRAWVTGFWLAWATRDAHSLALLTHVPVSTVVESDTFDRPVVDALQRALMQPAESGDRLIKALELADPDRVRRADPDWVLDILVPSLECVVRLLEHDERRFADALVKLLTIRREHFATGRAKGEDSVQHLSEEGVGLVAWAKTLGFTLDVESPYLPAALIGLAPPGVVVCPDCLTPLGDGEQPCDACGRAMKDDELRFDFDEWLSLDRDGCRSCGYCYPVIGKRCPVCLTPRGRTPSR